LFAQSAALGSTNRTIIPFCERRFTKLQEELVQTLKGHGSWGCDLDANRTFRGVVVDDK